MAERVEIAVIGAGVIGLGCAYRLAQAGHDVALIDPETPGAGASYGNAGTIADYAVMPVGSPDVLRDLPRLLFDRNSPLSIRHAAILSLAPWLARFAWQSLPKATARNAAAIAALTADAAPLWQQLAAEIGGSQILQHRGALYFYDSQKAFHSASADMAQRRKLGVSVDLVGPQDVAALEPGLPQTHGGAFFPNAVFMSDPAAMVACLASATDRMGVPHLRHAITRLEPQARHIRLTGPGLRLEAGRVVIAAGAHSKRLARMAGDHIPLETERGYHIEWDMPDARLSRPCCPTSRGFYLCPMAGRLRVAGTVELGGLSAPPSPHRLARLEQGARAIFPDLGVPSRTWMGFRPSIPDSVPVIGPGRDPRVIHAYGHGHIGLTLAPATADLVAGLIAARPAPDRLGACRVTRF
ncbi:MAG: NAD(P)/FAD-dependent oxidoreductase [Rhodobacterales bacterium]